MRKFLAMFLFSFFIWIGGFPVSAAVDTGPPDVDELLPQHENYLWNYWGIAEYGHEMEITSIIKEEEDTYYSVEGEMYDASGGASGADFSLSLSYIAKPDVLIQTKEEEMMLDSDFDRIELIRTPLEEGMAWTQTVTDENGNEVTLESEITNVEMDDGHHLYTIRYEDVDSSYYEERIMKENVGVVTFEKRMTGEGFDDYIASYTLSEGVSGVQSDRSFKDVSREDWYMEYVPALTSLDIIHGYPDGTFRSGEEVTVAEFLKLTMHSTSYKSENGTEVWYAPYVETALSLGVIEENEFENYNRPITREEMVKVVIRAIGGEASDSGEVAFEDADAISEEYIGFVRTAVELGIIEGYEDNTFRPEASSSRGETAKMLYYTLLIMEQDHMTPSLAMMLEDEFEARLFPAREGEKVTAFDTKAELIDHAAEVMDRNLAERFVENYYTEEEDGLYIIPKDGPTMIFPDQPAQLYMENRHAFSMRQVIDSEFIGPYRLTVSFAYSNGSWIMKDREIETHTGEEISVLDSAYYERVGREDLTGQHQSTIENNKAQRGYIIFPGETENEVILYAGSGEKPTEGYDIFVTAVVNQGDTTKVYLEETSPGPDEVVAEVITYPMEIVKIANAGKEIEVITTNSQEMDEIE